MTPEAITHPAIPLRHGFFTRRGGASSGPFASLNCSLSGQDDPDAVRANRAAVARSLGTEPDRLVGLTQVHGPDVVTVETPWPAGAGPRADAIVTRTPGIAIGVITADCTPVLLADPRAGVIGAVHAGWRGALAGVLEATIAAMQRLGATSITAAIGPCIRQPSYEVGPDLRDAVLAHDPAHARFFAEGRPGHWQFDLAGYCGARLATAHLIVDTGADTRPDETRFFSHRRRTLAGGGPIGHQISAIVL
ncbi:MAG: peptidoglycan editing factor PgeF [Acetobacteraceae bacterium]